MSPVKIPKSKLRLLLEQTASNQDKMTKLLAELEQTATGQAVLKPGLWRQHPKQWWLERVVRPQGTKRH
jgi:hypothetical protein